MKAFTTIIFVCLWINVQAQQWFLFPYLQQGHYQKQGSEHEVITFTADSIKPISTGFISYFNHKSDSHSCFASNYFKLKRYNTTIPDSIETTSDSSKLYFSGKFITFQTKNLGDSILFRTFNSKLASIRWSGVAIENVLGQADSVRTYVLKNNSQSYTLKWSKSFGLLHYINFFDLHESIPLASTYSLIGCKTISQNSGYQMPATDSFLPYQPGNVYLRKLVYDPLTGPAKITFSRDSIISVTHSSEEVTITGIREVFRYDKGIDTSFMFTSILTKKYWKIPAGDKGYLPFFTGNEKIVWHSKPAQIKTTDSATIRCFYSNNTLVSDTSCAIRQMTDTDYEICFCSGIGPIYSGSWMFSINSDTLIGWKTSTSSYGSIKFPVGQYELMEIQTPHLYPNPVKDILHIKSVVKNGNISIYNGVGDVILQQPFKTSIDVSHLPAGMYLLFMQSEQGEYKCRIIKN